MEFINDLHSGHINVFILFHRIHANTSVVLKPSALKLHLQKTVQTHTVGRFSLAAAILVFRRIEISRGSMRAHPCPSDPLNTTDVIGIYPL